MDPSRFDRIAARLAARRTSRRAVMGAAGGGIGVASFGAASLRPLTAQEATPAAGALPDTVFPTATADTSEFLFVQSFDGGSISPLAGVDGGYTLTLDGANPQTVYFSDRPERIFGLATTRAFLEGLGFTPDDPPNAALVVTSETGEEDVLILELFDPVWDEATGTLTYTVQILAEYADPGLAFAASRQADFEIPESFGQGGLFIDGCSDGRIYCHQRNPDGSQGAFVGPSPMTPFCFDFTASRCLPCAPPNTICAVAYPAQCIDRSSMEPRSRCGARGIDWP